MLALHALNTAVAAPALVVRPCLGCLKFSLVFCVGCGGQERLKAWTTSAIDPALHLPPPNPFIATNFSLKHGLVPPPPDEDLAHIDFNDPESRARVAGTSLAL